MQKKYTDKEIEFLNNISSNIYKKETTLSDCKKLILLSTEHDDLCEFLDKIISDLMIEDDVESWKEENIDFSNDEYINFLGTLIFETKNAVLELRDNFSKGLDNFLFTAHNISSIVHYLIVNYFNEFSFTQILFIALCSDLKVYINMDQIDYQDINDALQSAFQGNVIDIGDEEINLDGFWNGDSFDLNSCLSRATVATLSLILPIDNPDISEIQIASSIEDKVDEIKEFIQKEMTNPLSFVGDALLINNVEATLLDEEIMDETDSYPADFFADFINVVDLVEYNFIDFNEDFDGDGFGTEEAKKLCDFIDDKIDRNKEHDDYLQYLNEKQSFMLNAYKEKVPNFSKSLIEELEKNLLDCDSQALAGIAYFFGLAVDRNFKKAYNCFLNGYRLGSPECAYQLSVMYLKQLNGIFDSEQWLFYLNKACILGNIDAINQWKELKEVYVKVYPKEKLSPKFIDIEKKFAEHYSIKIKEKYIECSDRYLSKYIKYDDNYLNDINALFKRTDNLKYQLELFGLLNKLDEKDIDCELAYQIGEALGNMASRNPWNKDHTIHYDFDLTQLIEGPRTCWYIFAYDLGKKNIEEDFLMWYGHGNIPKNSYSDDLFFKTIINKQSFSLFRKYNPTNKELLIKLTESGFAKAYGYLIPVYVEENDYEKANLCGSKFLSVASDEDIKGLLYDINSEIKGKTSYKTNIDDYLNRKSKTLREKTNKQGCYIATCVYGSYDCPEVWVLRRYRDYKLNKSLSGRIFIKIYYAISPVLVKLFGNTQLFKKIFRGKLDKMVEKYKWEGYSDIPYNDLF